MTVCSDISLDGLSCCLVENHDGPHRQGTSYWFGDRCVNVKDLLEESDFTSEETPFITPAQLLGSLLTMTREERTRALEIILWNGKQAARCLQEDHAGLVEQYRKREGL